LHECWNEIEPYLFNTTVIVFLGNFAIEHLVKTHESISTARVNNPEYDPEHPDDSIPKTLVKFPDAFSDCLHNYIRFDYLCIFELLNRLYIDDNKRPAINNFDMLCQSVGISLLDKSKAVATGELFIKILNSVGATDILELKHLAGITFGEVCRNIVHRDKPNEKGEVPEYDKMFRPCLPITEDAAFRKFTFDLDKC
jgi:hypothetical protein